MKPRAWSYDSAYERQIYKAYKELGSKQAVSHKHCIPIADVNAIIAKLAPGRANQNLGADAAASAQGVEKKPKIGLPQLLAVCPKQYQAKLRAAKTPAARADLYYDLDTTELKQLRREYKALEDFVTKLEQWFIQEFQGDQKGVTGRRGRVEVGSKEVPTVKDWPKLYKHILKKQEFDLLNRALNRAAVQQRWEAGKAVPGVDKFTVPVVSLTGVKKK